MRELLRRKGMDAEKRDESESVNGKLQSIRK
jgi:hypothetical protein